MPDKGSDENSSEWPLFCAIKVSNLEIIIERRKVADVVSPILTQAPRGRN